MAQTPEELAQRVRCSSCGGNGTVTVSLGRKPCSNCGGWGVISSTRLGEMPRQFDAEVSESVIEAECTKLLEEDGWRALRTDPVSDRGRGKGFGEIGMADHLYIRYAEGGGLAHRSKCKRATAEILWVEFKSRTGKASSRQSEWHRNERARGGLTWIAGVDFAASVEGFVHHYRESGLNRGRV